MNHKAKLLTRLEEIGRALAQTGNALALLGLGSVGLERDRIDQYSDLDFFALVKAGHKQAFMDDLSWMSAPAPIAYHFKNTPDGYKLLYTDGIFCEFAVFELHEMEHIPFAAGQIVWKDPTFDESILVPTQPKEEPLNVEWQLGEALTNLYVGLGRYHRGEKLTAARFIQNYALDRALQLSTLIEKAQPGHADIFMIERRYEQRYPITAAKLGRFIGGYDYILESAAAILDFLDQHFEINPAMKQAITSLLK